MSGRFSSRSGGGRSFANALGLGSHLPPVTAALILICVGVYIIGLLFPDVSNYLLFAPVLAESEPYRFLTAAFLHGGFWHIVFNMYALALMGTILEPLFGRWRFLVLYMLSAVAGNVFMLLLAQPTDTSWITGTVGASGAVFGLFGALLILMRHIGEDTKGILIIIGLNLVIGFLPGSNISWQGHLGGLVMGILVTLALVARRSFGTRDRSQGNTSPSVRPLLYDIFVFSLSVLVLVGLVVWVYS